MEKILENNLFDSVCIKSELILNLNDFKEAITKYIDYEYYILVKIDVQYIKAYNYTENGSHELMIYGYDNDILFVKDFFEENKYVERKSNLLEVFEGFKNYCNKVDYNSVELICAKLKDNSLSNCNMTLFKKNILIFIFKLIFEI